jgi:hypothetical protein
VSVAPVGCSNIISPLFVFNPEYSREFPRFDLKDKAILKLRTRIIVSDITVLSLGM